MRGGGGGGGGGRGGDGVPWCVVEYWQQEMSQWRVKLMCSHMPMASSLQQHLLQATLCLEVNCPAQALTPLLHPCQR